MSSTTPKTSTERSIFCCTRLLSDPTKREKYLARKHRYETQRQARGVIRTDHLLDAFELAIHQSNNAFQVVHQQYLMHARSLFDTLTKVTTSSQDDVDAEAEEPIQSFQPIASSTPTKSEARGKKQDCAYAFAGDERKTRR